MRCITPVSIARPLGNGPKDRINVPCGRCLYCLQSKQSNWAIRLREELKTAKSAYFLTITYNDNHVKDCNKPEIQAFLKRLRKHHPPGDTQPSLKYYLVSEYGENTFRPHYHMIIFNLPYSIDNPLQLKKFTRMLDKTWGMGHIEIGSCTDASIAYTTKYIINYEDQKDMDIPEPFALMSKNLGRSYMTPAMSKYHKQGLRNFYTTTDKIKTKLPRYYSEKIFNIREKEKIAEMQLKESDKITDEEIKNQYNRYEQKKRRLEILKKYKKL